MKNILYTFLGMLLTVSVSAQLTNNGATIVIESGATLFVESDIVNDGTITNSGIIQVEGNFTNNTTLTSTATDSRIIFDGADNKIFKTNGASVRTLEMSKTAGNVTLDGDLTITDALKFTDDNNKLDVAGNTLTFEAGAGTDLMGTSGSYIVADGGVDAASMVVKEFDSATTFDFEIGDATNHTPITAETTAEAGATVGVNTVPAKQGNVPGEADDFINRFWNVEAAGFTTTDVTLTGTYVPGDLETGSDAASVKGAHFGATSSEWTYTDAAAGTNQVIGSIAESGDFTGTNSFGKIDMKIFLQGAYSGGTMTTALNASLIPLTSPYDAGVTVGSIPANVTDWINIELRDATTPSTVLSTTSAFLMNDGSIVGLDGTSKPLLIDPVGSTGHIAIKHRNHLPMRTAVAYDLSGETLFDFSTGLAQAYDNPALTLNDAMLDLGSGVFGMYRANVNSDNFINIVDAVLARINSNPSQVGVYSPFDVNLDGNVNILDSALARLQSNPSKSAHL